MKKSIKLTQTQLRSIIKESIQSRQPGSPLWEAPETGMGERNHPLDSDDAGISPAVRDLIQQLAEQIVTDMAAVMDGDYLDADMLHPEAMNAITAAVEQFYQDAAFT